MVIRIGRGVGQPLVHDWEESRLSMGSWDKSSSVSRRIRLVPSSMKVYMVVLGGGFGRNTIVVPSRTVCTVRG